MDCSATASLVNLVAIFKRYASRDEDKDDLSKSELKELLLNEFPMLVDEGAKPDDINQILDDLDQNGDGRVDITEYFVILVAVGVVLFELSKDTEQM